VQQKSAAERFVESYVGHLGLLLLTGVVLIPLFLVLLAAGVEVTARTSTLILLGCYLAVLAYDDVRRPRQRR
jgi:predicted ABC-type exoprotein transport system permease subunit